MNGSLEAIIHALRKARETKRWNQRELSAKLRMPQAHLSRIERGIVDPKLSTVIELARMLEHELVLIPRQCLNLVKALTKPDDASDQRSVYALEDEE